MDNENKIQCWFCKKICDPFYRFCKNEECLKYDVLYTFNSPRDNDFRIYCARFIAYINSMEFSIRYYPLDQYPTMEVLRKFKRINESFEGGVEYYYTNVLNIKYNSLILTPKNIQTKLPTLLTFS